MTTTATAQPTVHGFQTREEWLAHRTSSQRIGASDAAAALGESPWTSQLTLWARKTGAEPGPEETPNMRIGSYSESNAIGVFNILHESKGVNAEHPSNVLRVAGGLHIVESGIHPWMSASPDAFTYESDGAGGETLGILEIKCPGADKIHDWREGPPLEYLIQVYHQFIVLREALPTLSKIRLAAWFGGADLIVHEIDEPDEEMIEWILRDERRMWDRIQNKQAPPPDGSKSSIATLKQMVPEIAPATTVELPRALVERYFEARARRELYEKEEKALHGDVLAAMGANEEGHVDGAKCFTQRDTTYNYPAKAAYSDTRRVFSAVRNWRKIAEQHLGLSLTQE